MKRKDFISSITFSLTSVTIGSSFLFSYSKKKALHWVKLNDKKVRCTLCPHYCILSDGERGKCRTRENLNGTLYSLSYNHPVSINIDPIEKKPFFHFLPGSLSFSIATAGCPLRCKYCQNWTISQSYPEELKSYFFTPYDIVNLSKKYKTPTIAFTYSEPVAFYEYMFEISKIAKPRGIKPIAITSGFFSPKSIVQILQYLSAVKVDLKSFSNSFYEKIVGGKLKPVLRTIEIIKKSGVWLEIVYLIIPTLNDSEKEIRELSKWIVKNIGNSVPIHFSRFFPQYKMKNLPPTPIKTLERAYSIAKEEGLKFVYIGNVFGHKYESTYCPNCRRVLIKRIGYKIIENNITGDGKCKFCKTKIEGIWKK